MPFVWADEIARFHTLGRSRIPGTARRERHMPENVMRRLATLGTLVVLLAGCEAIDRMDRQIDQAACDGFGFQRGTDAYATA